MGIIFHDNIEVVTRGHVAPDEVRPLFRNELTSGKRVGRRLNDGWIRDVVRKYAEPPPSRGPDHSTPTRTKTELRLEMHLRKRGIPFRAQVPIRTREGRFVVDFLVSERCVVECEGGVHSRTVLRDNWREDLIRAAGFSVVRLANFQVYDDIPGCIERIRAASGGSAA